MIKLGMIVAPRSLAWSHPFLTDYHLILAHLVEGSPVYKQFYTERAAEGHYITLDNSSFEIGDDKYSPSQLIDMALEVGATEIMAPETYLNHVDTMRKMAAFMAEFRKRDTDLKVFGTVHGESFCNVRDCYQAFVGLGVHTIGFSCRLNCYDASPHVVAENYPTLNSALVRASIVRRLLLEGTLNENVRHHLLGLNHPMELCMHADLSDWDGRQWIASCDSSIAYVNAWLGVGLEKTAIYHKPGRIDFRNPPEDPEPVKELFARNAGFMMRLSRGEC